MVQGLKSEKYNYEVRPASETEEARPGTEEARSRLLTTAEWALAPASVLLAREARMSAHDCRVGAGAGAD